MITFKTTHEFNIEVEINDFNTEYDDISGRLDIESNYGLYILVKNEKGILQKIKLNYEQYKSVYKEFEDDVNDKIIEYLEDMETEQKLSRIA
jgi:hypothetical protein